MTDALDSLLQLLELERIEEGIFRGKSQDLGFGAVFGGQVMGQALSAAKHTVTETRQVHSFHSYFLRPGDPRKPILYLVEPTRDGRSFSSRRIQAVQRGRPILFMAASFQEPEEGLDHQATMPQVPEPEELEPYSKLMGRFLDRIPASMRPKIAFDRPIEMRPVQVVDPLAPEPADPVRHIWLRAEAALPDDLGIHRYLLAYASDFSLLATALLPHGRSFWQGNLKMATIDHAMWFHRDLRFDDWLLYAMDSPSASGARGLVRGELFDRKGRLVASTVQEGLIRELTAR